MKIYYIIFLISYLAYLLSVFYIMIKTNKYKTSRAFFIDWIPGGYVIRLIIEKLTKIENGDIDG